MDNEEIPDLAWICPDCDFIREHGGWIYEATRSTSTDSFRRSEIANGNRPGYLYTSKLYPKVSLGSSVPQGENANISDVTPR